MTPNIHQIELTRFLDAQNQVYLKALSEIKNARKQTNWMWFVFPQLLGTSQSETSGFYAIRTIDEAAAYLAHPVLGKHLVESSRALLEANGESVSALLGSPDDLNLRSSMTLFANVDGADAVFQRIIDTYFNGLHDEHTLRLLIRNKLQYDTV